MIVNRCPRCMEELHNSKKCPGCGMELENFHPDPHMLRPYSILHGKYLVGTVLGRGGFGSTYMGFDLNLQMKVAIKEYYPREGASRNSCKSNQILWSPQQLQSGHWQRGCQAFLSEARKLARVNAIPQIAGIRDTFEENQTAYIVMDYVPGITLADHIKSSGVFTYRDLVTRLLPLIEGLDRVHKAGILHRDISPSSMMLMPDGRICLLDLGAAKDLQSPAASSGFPLNPRFSPIEQHSSNGTLGPWTDIYAMAASVYACIYGKTLPPASERALNQGEPDFSAKLKEPLTAKQISVLRKALAVKPEQRYQSAAEFHAALEDSLTGKNGKAADIPRAKRLGVIIGGAAAAAALVLGLLLWMKPWYPSVKVSGCADGVRGNSTFISSEDYEYFSDLDGALRMARLDKDENSFNVSGSTVIFDQDPDIFDDGISCLNLSEDALYAIYDRGSGSTDICIRMNFDGTDPEQLFELEHDSGFAQYVRLSNRREYIYYLMDDGSEEAAHHMGLYRYDLKKESSERVLNREVSWFSLHGKYLYYSALNEESGRWELMRSTLDGKHSRLLNDTRSFSQGFIEDGRLYLFQTLNKNGDPDPGLVQCSFRGKIESGENTILEIDPDRIPWCAGGGSFYYQERGTDQLYRMELDGTDSEQLTDGYAYHDLCFTNGYLYFMDGTYYEDAFMPSHAYLLEAEGGTPADCGFVPTQQLTTPQGLQFMISDGQARLTGYVGTSRDVVVPLELYGFPVIENISAETFYTPKVDYDHINFYKTIPVSDLEYVRKADQITVTGYSGKATASYNKLAIPSYIEDLPVTVIDDSVFAERPFSHIYFPDCLREIGEEAFLDCHSLIHAVFPKSLRTIEKKAFSGCSFDGETIEIPEGVEFLGMDFLCSCTPAHVYLPSTLTNMGDGFLHLCGGEYHVSPENELFLSEDGFVYSKDKSVLVSAPAGLSGKYSIAYGVKKIAPYAFCATQIEGINIGAGVTTIGKGAFMQCRKLWSVSFPYSVRSIEKDAFAETNLGYAKLPRECEVHPQAFPAKTTITRSE